MFYVFFVILQNSIRFAFGPQHPASHGVLTCVLFLTNDFISMCDCHIGYLHRGTEKCIEYKCWEHVVPFFDRLDYVSVVCNEHMLCFAFENLLRGCLSLRVSLIRCCVLELTRVFNGLLAISCMMFDVGCVSPLLYAFEEREKCIVFFDFLSGVRMHCAFFCICGVLDDFSFGILDFVFFLLSSLLFLCEIFDLCCVVNRLAYIRLRGIALLDLFDLSFISISGVLARSVGILWDCRFCLSYEVYAIYCFNLMFCVLGDAFDRFLSRLFDMRNAIFIVKQSIVFVRCFGYYTFFYNFNVDLVIETVIYMFLMCWFISVPGIALSCVEHPKGEYSCVLSLFIFVCSRCRIRCADYISVMCIDVLCRGFLLADLVACIGNLDVVFGSVDR